MESLIYFLEEEVNDLFRQSSDKKDFYEGLAYSQDNNTIFHVFKNSPKVIPSGILINCFLNFSPRENFDENIKSYLGNFIEASKKKKKREPTVVAFFSVALSNKIECKTFFYDSTSFNECVVKYMPSKTELYSRNKGLIETSILKEKTVSIVGVGSGGSFIALELAKAGIGKFNLFDFDRIELSNISRHICGVNDLGRYKTLAVRDYIWQKNPSAEITTYEININERLEEFKRAVKNSNLIICASDTNTSRYNVNQVSLNLKTVSIYGRAITRAAGGDVLRVRPFEGPCLNCLFSTGLVSKEEEMSQMRQVRSEMPAYVSDAEAMQMIQVGLSSDIVPIANMVTKLALVELSKGAESGISSLEEDLIADFYLWANRRERIYAQWPKMEYGFNKQSILRWYGAKVRRDENCIVCGEKKAEGENIFV